jgi:hypothetical protein
MSMLVKRGHLPSRTSLILIKTVMVKLIYQKIDKNQEKQQLFEMKLIKAAFPDFKIVFL